MIKIFTTLLENGTWGDRAFNLDYVIFAKPSKNSGIILTTLVGEFEVKASLMDLCSWANPVTDL